MTTFVFGLEDLARTRFAISPMWELVSSIRALRNPAEGALLVPWFERVRPKLPPLDLAAALALTPPKGYIPDFISPPPTTPLAVFEEELELVGSTPVAQVRHDVETLARLQYRRAVPEVLRPFLDHPRKALNRLAKSLAAYWEVAIAPYWPRVDALLHADVHHRARRLTEGGPAALFADLHPTVHWDDGELLVEQEYQAVVPLEGRSLLLVPSAFGWVAPATMTEDPWQPTVFYPARGVATLWEAGVAEAPEALAAVLGRGRADLLAALHAPCSTSDIARRLGITPGAVSQHIGALRAAGLVASDREGRNVLHARTALADALVGGASADAPH
jgi:DNA-binding transcriptional ArsR family regulator